jgi:aspartate kinase
MRIFKFGGASIKDAAGVKNVASILTSNGYNDILVVISAMGKTTNALESVIHHCYHQTGEVKTALQVVFDYHNSILSELSESSDIFGIEEINQLFIDLEQIVVRQRNPDDYDFLYDQIIVYGELIATKIVSHYLLSMGIENQWVDARDFILTDSRYRDARVRWEETEKAIQSQLITISQKNLVITQGFIGKGNHGESTTLGREGSDYSAAIFGSVLGAESITIWKDVAGVMNADPKKFENAVLIPSLTYNDAIELAYYGASVIHPKTIQPLKANHIPLFVRSFLNPTAPGTKVSDEDYRIEVPCKIHKDNQLLIEISTKDFTFIAEDHLKQIFQAMSENKVRCNLMQNSAIVFRCVIDNKENKHKPLVKELEELGLAVSVKTDLELLSIYHPDGAFHMGIEIASNRKVVLQQNMGNSIHYLLKADD